MAVHFDEAIEWSAEAERSNQRLLKALNKKERKEKIENAARKMFHILRDEVNDPAIASHFHNLRAPTFRSFLSCFLGQVLYPAVYDIWNDTAALPTALPAFSARYSTFENLPPSSRTILSHACFALVEEGVVDPNGILEARTVTPDRSPSRNARWNAWSMRNATSMQSGSPTIEVDDHIQIGRQ